MANSQNDTPPKPLLEEVATTNDGFYNRLGSALMGSNALTFPKDTTLFKLGGAEYKRMLRDDQVRSTFQQRRLAVIARNWSVTPGGDRRIDKKAAEHLSEQLMNIRWDSVTEKMLYGLHYGYAVAEIMWKIDGGLVGIDRIRVRDRLRFRFDVEGRLRLLTTAHPEGQLMPDAKFWTFICGADNDDEFYGEGLGYALYWPVWFKREGLKSWLQGLDKTARPTAVGKFPAGATPEDIEKLLETLRAIASDTGIALPESMSAELLEAKRTGTADYNTLYGRMDAAISKIILSQTMTTDSSASGLGSNQADVHADVKLDVVKADSDLLCESFNAGPAKWITEWNFPGAEPPTVMRQVEEPEDISATSERDERLYNMGFRPTADRVSEVYGEGYEQFERPAPARPGEAPPAPETGDFAEAHTHERDEVDALTELALGDWQELMEPMVSPIRDLVERATSYEEVRDGLIGLLDEMDDEALTTSLANAGFNIRLAAQVGAIGEDDDV